MKYKPSIWHSIIHRSGWLAGWLCRDCRAGFYYFGYGIHGIAFGIVEFNSVETKSGEWKTFRVDVPKNELINGKKPNADRWAFRPGKPIMRQSVLLDDDELEKFNSVELDALEDLINE